MTRNASCWMGLCVGVWMVCAAGALAQAPVVPDPSIMLPLVPEAARAGPPAWCKPGTRITYFGMTASIPGERKQMVLDENGKWVDQATGQRYDEQDIPGAAGAGYNVLQVGYVDRDIVQISSRLYTVDTLRKTSTYSAGGGLVAHAGCAADYWIHPDVLKEVKEVNAAGVRILRMPYMLNGRVYKAIRFQNDNEKGYSAYVYDLESGRMIFHGSRTQGANVLTPPPAGGGAAGVGQGSTQIITGWIMDVRDIDVPWKDAPAPPWVGQFRQIRYEGVQSSLVAGAGEFGRGMVLTISPTARGANWLRFSAASTLQTPPGMPPEQGQSNGTSGQATIGGLWISPQAIAKLRQGQEIERNDLTQTATSVTEAGRGRLVISEVGRLHRLDFAYDPASGMLTSLTTVQQIGLGRITHNLRLAGQQ